MNAFNTIKQTTILPLIFRIFGDYEEVFITEDVLCKVLSYLLAYFIRTNACEINKNMAKFMKSLYARVIDDSYENYFERFVVFLNDKPLYKKNIPHLRIVEVIIWVILLRRDIGQSQ